MTEVNLNSQLAELLTNHGVKVTIEEEFIHAQLPFPVKFKARAIYQPINDYISSQLDVMAMTPDGEKILESFGDFGSDIEAAVNRNLSNFSISNLHVVLAAFGADDKDILAQITIENWEINGRKWTAYIGNLVPKTNSKEPGLRPPDEFFNAITTGILSKPLCNNLHWFRAYYLQHNNKITATEFIMNNEDITSSNPLFSSIPLIPHDGFYSCRNFIILRSQGK